MTGLYLQPIGLLYGEVARDAVSVEAALPLAGGSIAFSAVRLWEGEPGNVKHAIARIGAIQAIHEPRVKDLLDRLVAPREAIAGVSMDSPRIMGIVNVTPDSFSDGGKYLEPNVAIERAKAFSNSGADFIDIGGESTRPGSEPVSAEEELRRVLPVLSGLTEMLTPISIDTRKSAVMREAAKIRANIINDASALTFSPDSLTTLTELKIPAVLTHAMGDPKTMQDNPTYQDVVIEVYDYLEKRMEAASATGLPTASLIVDPGIGFGKTAEHNASLLRNISLFHGLGVPLLAGSSRKRSLQKLTGANTPKEQVAGNIAAALDAVSQGVQIVRVHDVEETHRALAVWKWLRGAAKAQERFVDNTDM